VSIRYRLANKKEKSVILGEASQKLALQPEIRYLAAQTGPRRPSGVQYQRHQMRHRIAHEADTDPHPLQRF
jgi:hypothetical protein